MDSNPLIVLVGTGISLLVGCVAAFVIAVGLSNRLMKSVSAKTEANAYLIAGSVEITGREDHFTHTTEIRQKIEEFLEKSGKLRRAKYNRMLVFGIFRPMVYMLFVTSNLFLFYIGCKGYIRDTTFLGQTITSEIVVAT